MFRYFIEERFGGFVVCDRFNNRYSKVYTERADVEALRKWLEWRWHAYA